MARCKEGQPTQRLQPATANSRGGLQMMAGAGCGALPSAHPPGNSTSHPAPHPPAPTPPQLLRDDTVWDALPTAPNPVLVVAGGRDDTVPPANQRAIAERAPAPWLVTYPDAAHGAFLQHAASLLPVLDAFLAGDAGQLA